MSVVKTRVEKECPCGEKFVVYKNNLNQRYCSWKCYQDYRPPSAGVQIEPRAERQHAKRELIENLGITDSTAWYQLEWGECFCGQEGWLYSPDSSPNTKTCGPCAIRLQRGCLPERRTEDGDHQSC